MCVQREERERAWQRRSGQFLPLRSRGSPRLRSVSKSRKVPVARLMIAVPGATASVILPLVSSSPGRTGYRWLRMDMPNQAPSRQRCAPPTSRASIHYREGPTMAGIVRKRDTWEKGNGGEFGTTKRDEADVRVTSDAGADCATGAALVERFGFDVRTADPVEFDQHAKAASGQLSTASSRLGTRLDGLHRAIGDRKSPAGAWCKSDQEVIEAAREWVTIANGGGASETTGIRLRGPLRDAQAAQENMERAREQVDGLDEAFRIRGGWNRAFLVANAGGHVHSSTSCSTCRSTTQYAWMTDYSGADEDAIVSDAGYRACTACYPSAPVGDERSLPTKILTDEEKQDEASREKERAAREAKKTKAAANAPTSTGEPLRVRNGMSQYPETLKTERTAKTWVVDGVLDEASFVAYREQFEDADTNFPGSAVNRSSRETIVESLADKHGTDADDIRDELRQKAHAKAKRECSDATVRDRITSQIDDLFRPSA